MLYDYDSWVLSRHWWHRNLFLVGETDTEVINKHSQ